jgi:hypothetical protein
MNEWMIIYVHYYLLVPETCWTFSIRHMYNKNMFLRSDLLKHKLEGKILGDICCLLCLAYSKVADKNTEHVTTVTGHFNHTLTRTDQIRKNEI